LGEKRLARTRGSDHQDVALLELDVVVGSIGDALVMVINRYGQGSLGNVLTDDIAVQVGDDLLWLGHARRVVAARTQDMGSRSRRRRGAFLVVMKDIVAEVDTV